MTRTNCQYHKLSVNVGKGDCETLKRHTYNNRKQEEGPSFDVFFNRFQVALSKNCNCCDRCFDGILRYKIVEDITSDSLRKINC